MFKKYRNEFNKFEAYIKEIVTPLVFVPTDTIENVIKENKIEDQLTNYLTEMFPEAKFYQMAVRTDETTARLYIRVIVEQEVCDIEVTISEKHEVDVTE